MDESGAIMTPFWGIVIVILVVTHVHEQYKLDEGNDNYSKGIILLPEDHWKPLYCGKRIN